MCPRFLPGPGHSKVTGQTRLPQSQESSGNEVVSGYGVSLCFNTDLGQDDMHVIRLVQDGLSGESLKSALKQVGCYATFF